MSEKEKEISTAEACKANRSEAVQNEAECVKTGFPLLRACFKLVRLEKLYDKYEEAILYLFFGGLTTLISIVTKLVIFQIIEDKGQFWRDDLAVTVSWIFAVTFAFFTNKKYVFKSVTHGKAEFIKVMLAFYEARIATYLLELLIFFVFCDKLNMSETVITIAGQFIILVANYFFSKLLVFGKKKKSTSE